MITERSTVALAMEDEYVLVAAAGEFDVHTAPDLRSAMLEASGSPRPGVVVDLSDVTFLDSSGLGVLVGGLKRATASGQWMRLVCPNARILRLFELTGLTKVFDLYPTVDAALGKDVPHPTESPED